MASFNFNEGLRDLVNSYLGSGTFKMLLVTVVPGETEKDTWDFLDDVTNQVANGNGYTTGGEAVTLTVAEDDDTNNDVEVTAGAVTWPTATITAVAAIIYKDTGNAATSPLICSIDFGQSVASTNGDFTVTPTGSMKFQN